MNFFMEVAKLRAARLLWAKLLRQFEPKNAKSLSLRTHSQTSGWSLTAQDVFNNVVRTCVEAMAATQGHTQSLHTNALDEALALPTDFSARIARNTQLLLQQESGTTKVIDPWGGSHYVERLTYDLARRAWAHITEVEKAGGMAQAIDAGIPKLRVEEAAARTQARIDSGRQPVIGVNKFVTPPTRRSTSCGWTTPTSARSSWTSCAGCARNATSAPSTRALTALTNAAAASAEGSPRSHDDNLLALSIAAARAKATVGEISDALEKVFGRHAGRIRIISGVYAQEAGAGPAVTRAREAVAEFAAEEGRQPRILVAKMGQDGHDRGQKVIATAFADLGFDVDVGPLFSTPAEVARQAVEADVHVVGVSSLAAGHLTLVPELRAELARLERPDIMVVVGGVIPPADVPTLHEMGAAAVFGPGTVIAEAAVDLLAKLSLPCTGRQEADGPRSRRSRAGQGGARRLPRDAGPGDHPGRVAPRRPPRGGAGAAAGAAAAVRRRAPRGDQRGARGREVDLRRGAGDAAHRRRAPGGGAGGRPVVDAGPEGRSSATRRGWNTSPSTRTRSCGRRRVPGRSAGSPGRPGRRSC